MAARAVVSLLIAEGIALARRTRLSIILHGFGVVVRVHRVVGQHQTRRHVFTLARPLQQPCIVVTIVVLVGGPERGRPPAAFYVPRLALLHALAVEEVDAIGLRGNPLTGKAGIATFDLSGWWGQRGVTDEWGVRLSI